MSIEQRKEISEWYEFYKLYDSDEVAVSNAVSKVMGYHDLEKNINDYNEEVKYF